MRILILAVAFTLLSCAVVPSEAAKTMPMDICDMLKNSPVYTEGIAYSDLASSASILADNPAGVGTMILDADQQSLVLARSLAALDVLVSENSSEKALAPDSPASSYPHGIISTGHSGDIQAKWFTTFVDQNVIACWLEVENKGKSDVTLTPRIRGEVAEQPDIALRASYEAERNMMAFNFRDSRDSSMSAGRISTTDLGVISSFLEKDCELGDSASGLCRNWTLTGSNAAYVLTGDPFVLAVGKTKRLWMLISVSTDGYGQMKDAVDKNTHQMDVVLDPEKTARKRVDDLLGKMPKPNGDQATDSLYYRSISAMLRNVGVPGGKFGKNRPCFATRGKNVVTQQDASIIALALAEIDPALAQEQMLILTENPADSSDMSEVITRDSASTTPFVQQPLAAWAAWQVYERKRNVDFLKQVYAPLSQWTEWWFREHDRDSDKLLEVTSVSATSVPDTIYDSVVLSSEIAVQMDSLANIARALGRDLDARSWANRALDVKKRILSTLYDPATNLFYDATVTKHELQKTMTPGCFLPLWANVPMQKGKERDMARDYLLSTKYFFGDIPFPDVPFTDPRYASGSQVTPLTAYLMIGALRGGEHGYSGDARRARDCYLRMVSKAGNSEAFDAKTGAAIGSKENAVTAAVSVSLIAGR